ncbi:MAG: UDP-glucose 4-epimerase GalE [Stappia sp.]|uniref:UDP-glucose 4-epimerase GalE n=1 Tax=Stappia sp. TaxID=1870903 RepID=UPI000C3D32A8|nr:UDP-glucose 4-epimerase GalE [Stappia sp.]MAA97757.1 UDP-glucose 4-epimerase GalE [Stappia sp.]MBM20626.1 UDP-glucose 4-epimerase GalE [Stappia sp.]
MAVLVTGGAGYIGSHMVWRLLDAGEEVVVIDNLSTGHAWSVPGNAHFIEGDIDDPLVLARASAAAPLDAVVHFAGSVVVPDSIREPLRYYRNNTFATLALLEHCVATGIERFIFSSTAAIYGDTGERPVRESDEKAPETPYGRSKLMIERMLDDVARASTLRYASLRYFNVVGADPQQRTGQSTEGASHLLKVACEAATGKREGMAVFGTDYPTRDGTAERDFIHVTDLVDAHYLSLKRLREFPENFALNCGYGHGVSVLDLIRAVKDVSGTDFPVRYQERRAGDLAQVVADNTAIRETLNWAPRHDELSGIVRDALEWERRLTLRNAPQ